MPEVDPLEAAKEAMIAIVPDDGSSSPPVNTAIAMSYAFIDIAESLRGILAKLNEGEQ